MRVVVALGGNAILRKGARGTAAEQRETIRNACAQLVDLVERGHELVLTHGNGPQVGRLLIQQRLAEREIPPMPLDVLDAQTQGALGYLLQQQLGNVMRAHGLMRDVVGVVTQVVVDPDDPAFAAPDKPVGPHYTEIELEHRLDVLGVAGDEITVDAETYRKVDGRSWRRVVASPQPIDIIEIAAVRALLEAGVIPICAGGGGAPVIRGADGDGPRDLAGIEAVVDKDRTAALLTRQLGADVLLVLTDVERVAVGYGTPSQRWLDRLDPEEAGRLLATGEFPAGSMGPKVAAAVDVAARGGRAVITSLNRAADAVDGNAGTQVTAT